MKLPPISPLLPRHPAIRVLGLLAHCAVVMLLTGQSLLADTAADVAAAQALFDEGKYAEAEEGYHALSESEPVFAAVGIARCQTSTGHRDEAAKTLANTVEKHPTAAILSAEQALLALNRGDNPACGELVERALKLDPNSVLGHYVRAELNAHSGKLDDALADYSWLVDHYNANDVTDRDELLWIGRGAAQFARWKRLSEQFRFLVNDFYPELAETSPACWQAHLDSARLFAEKYNEAEAVKSLAAAISANPNAAEVHALAGTLALDRFEVKAAQASCDQARAINPELLAAHHLQADIHLANFEPRQAAGVLQDALKLNPTSEETLGRLAAAYLSVDGPQKREPESRFGKLAAEVNARNPRAGVFYLTLADALDRLRRWPTSAEFYREAMTRMPQLIEPPGRLGMMLMRLGEEEEAKRVLDSSFEADPFNVRVKNTLEVLDVLAGYETLETGHFLIRFDPAKDKITARYMGVWLEEVYPQLVERLGYAPPEKSLFEVFSKARNTDGHGWFSARMAGVARIHPIGACAGKIVALSSPTEGRQEFNWARVLKHEFVHVVNLQQTDFNIPHWFTEALAVLSEESPRPDEWNALLVKKSAAGKLFNLDTINLGFIRPLSSDEWTLAYCQAELYAEYMLQRFGKDALAKMLTAYGDNLTTTEAIRQAFGVEQPDFERGYQEYVAKVVADLPVATEESAASLAEIQKALVDKPNDPELLAQLALAQLNRKNYPEARRRADAALKFSPKQQLAHYVRARLHLVVGENAEALQRLEQNLDRNDPQPNLLALLAGLKLRSEDFAAAAELYELGANHEPGGTRWLKSLASVYLKSGDDEKLRPILAKLAEADPDDLPLRKKLAQLAIQRQDLAAAERWTREGLHIQVLDANLHAWRGAALAGLEQHAQAAEEYAVAVELSPDEPELRVSQAQALIAAGRQAEGRAVLEVLLKREADHEPAKKLLKSLE